MILQASSASVQYPVLLAFGVPWQVCFGIIFFNEIGHSNGFCCKVRCNEGVSFLVMSV